jgi:multiple sugar transport system substrate-binding protein
MSRTLLDRRISSRARALAAPAGLGAVLLGRAGIVRAQDAPTVRLTGYTSSPVEQELFEEVLADLQAAHTELTLEYEPVPSDYFTKLQTDIAAGTVADVFYLNDLQAPDLMAADQLLALDDYMAESGVSADDFFPALIGNFQWGGQTYGLPKDFSTLAMVYDNQALSDAGVASPPANWDELRAAGETLLEANGVPGIVIQPSLDRYLPFHYAGGGQILSEDGSQIVVESPEAEAALEFYYGLYRDGIATTAADAGAQWPGDALAKGLGYIVFEGNWVFPFLQENAPDLDFGIAEMPEGPAGKATLAFTVSFSSFVDTQVPDAAWSVIEYLTGPEGMSKWTSLGLAMPSRRDLSEAWQEQFPDRQPFIAGGEYAWGWQFGVGGQAFNDDASTQLQGLFAGQLDVPETLALIQAAGEDRLQLGVSPAASPSPSA